MSVSVTYTLIVPIPLPVLFVLYPSIFCRVLLTDPARLPPMLGALLLNEGAEVLPDCCYCVLLIAATRASPCAIAIAAAIVARIGASGVASVICERYAPCAAIYVSMVVVAMLIPF